MHEAVSSVLIGRSREADGLNRMIVLSLLTHAVVIATFALAPRDWFAFRTAPEQRRMVISMGLPPGSPTGGQTALASRTVEAVAPPKTPSVVTPPPPKTPAMTVPDPKAKVTPPAKPNDKAADKSASKKLSTGAEIKKGSARAETGGAETPWRGLSQGGGGTGGARVEGDFCCPEYIETMKRLIYANWQQNQGAAGQTEVKFIIRRDGMLTNVEVEKTSGNPLLDLESRRSVLSVTRLPPLPEQFTRPSLTVYLLFEYKR
jgi:TonB family protein